MLSRKLFRWVHKIALLSIVFASLAPSISHALAAQQGVNSFAQEICSTNGKKIIIQVVTSKGQQLATELGVNQADNRAPTGIQHHLEHCPLCANPSTDAVVEAPHTPIIAILTAQAQHISVSTQPVLPRSSVLPPPAQAPPSI